MKHLALFLFLLSPSLGFADESLFQIYSPTISGNVLTIKGEIDSHIYDYLAYEAQALKSVDTVELNSYGGNAEWALQIAQKLKDLKFKTRLSSGNVCASACVLLFAAGKDREADDDTWIGIHGARFGAGYTTTFQGLCFVDMQNGPQFMPGMRGCKEFLDQWYATAQKMTADMFSFMEGNGVLPQLRSTYLAMPDDPNWPAANNVFRKPDWILKSTDALSFQLVTKITSH